MIVLGVDPGFRSFGWSVLRLRPTGEELVALGVIRTAKSDKKLNTRSSSDLHRRGRELATALVAIADEHRPTVICAEAISLVRSASVSAQIGRAWGFLDVLCATRGLPLLEVSPQDLKRKVTGDASATKADVQRVLDERFRGRIAALLASIRAKGEHEHPVDAVGAVIACLDAESMLMARRMSDPAFAALERAEVLLAPLRATS